MRLNGKLPLERLSATSLAVAITCPEQFRHRYVLRVPEALSGERFMGSVTHRALQKLYTRPGLDEQESVAESWQEVIDSDGEPEWHDVDSTESFRRTKQMLKAYKPIVDATVGAVTEQRFEERIAGYPVSGYIDLELPDRIREVKTSGQKVSTPKSRWQLQGRLYSLVSAKPIEWHVITRQATPQVYVPSESMPALYVPGFNHDVTVRIVEQTIHRLSDYMSRYGANTPWPTDGIMGDWTCRYCSYKGVCPAWQ